MEIRPVHARFLPLAERYGLWLRLRLYDQAQEGYGGGGYNDWIDDFQGGRFWENPTVEEFARTCFQAYYRVHIRKCERELRESRFHGEAFRQNRFFSRLADPYYDHLKCVQCGHQHHPGRRYWIKIFDHRNHSLNYCVKCGAESVEYYTPPKKVIPKRPKPWRN